MNETPQIRFLEWDSTFFGKKIALLNQEILSEQLLQNIQAWVAGNAVDCVYFLADPSNSETIRLAESSHFSLVDIRVVFEHKLESIPDIGRTPKSAFIRPYIKKDLPELQKIAGSSFTDSRFYFDHHFPNNLCDQMYEIWITNSCEGGADLVLVAEVDGHSAGFITCHLEGNEGKIGLVGVSQAYQGRSLGPDLVHQALRWFAEQGAGQVLVATQGRNIRAQRLYQRCGFLTRSLRLWYHWWPND